MLAIIASFARFLFAVATVTVDVAASQIMGLTKTPPVGVAATSATALDSLEGVLERYGSSLTVVFGEEMYGCSSPQFATHDMCSNLSPNRHLYQYLNIHGLLRAK